MHVESVVTAMVLVHKAISPFYKLNLYYWDTLFLIIPNIIIESVKLSSCVHYIFLLRSRRFAIFLCNMQVHSFCTLNYPTTKKTHSTTFVCVVVWSRPSFQSLPYQQTLFAIYFFKSTHSHVDHAWWQVYFVVVKNIYTLVI